MKILTIDHHRHNSPTESQERGALFGDGFFTTGLIENFQLLHVERHQKRLVDSAQQLLFSTFDSDSLFSHLAQIVCQVEKAVVRISVTRSQALRGYAIANSQDCTVTIQLFPWLARPTKNCHAFFAETPPSINPRLAGIKHLNRLDSVLAATEIMSARQEALLCIEESVICGSKSNLFIRVDNSWFTPKLNLAGIEGITKQRLMENMRAEGIIVTEKEITRCEVERAESAFLTNSLLGIWPVSKVEERKLATQFTGRLQSLLNFSR